MVGKKPKKTHTPKLKLDADNPFIVKAPSGEIIDIEKEMDRMLGFWDKFNEPRGKVVGSVDLVQKSKNVTNVTVLDKKRNLTNLTKSDKKRNTQNTRIITKKKKGEKDA